MKRRAKSLSRNEIHATDNGGEFLRKTQTLIFPKILDSTNSVKTNEDQGNRPGRGGEWSEGEAEGIPVSCASSRLWTNSLSGICRYLNEILSVHLHLRRCRHFFMLLELVYCTLFLFLQCLCLSCGNKVVYLFALMMKRLFWLRWWRRDCYWNAVSSVPDIPSLTNEAFLLMFKFIPPKYLIFYECLNRNLIFQRRNNSA